MQHDLDVMEDLGYYKKGVDHRIYLLGNDHCVFVFQNGKVILKHMGVEVYRYEPEE